MFTHEPFVVRQLAEIFGLTTNFCRAAFCELGLRLVSCGGDDHRVRFGEHGLRFFSGNRLFIKAGRGFRFTAAAVFLCRFRQ
ncbi:MAG: hypothetical protein WCT37_02965 [Patescibacteria group bacterium]